MTLWQFGLEPEVATVAVRSTDNLFFPTLILISLGVGFLIFLCLLALRHIFRFRSHARSSTFHQVVIQVTVPRFRRESETERQPSKEEIHEAIAAGETFFSAIGGMKAQKGFHAWLFGRTDEMSFEIVVSQKTTKFFIAIPKRLQSHVEQQLSAAYPDAHLEEVKDYNIFQPQSHIVGSYLVFKKESVLPIRTYRKLDKDPLNAITNMLAKVPEEDGAAFQFIVRSARPRWRQRGVSIARHMQQGMTLSDALHGGKKKKFSLGSVLGIHKEEPKEPERDHRLSPQEDELVKGIEEKVSKAGLEVTARLIASSKDMTQAKSVLQNMLNAFAQYNIYEYGNSFTKVVPPFQRRLIRRFIYRMFSEPHKIILSCEEMASLWHLPLPWTETPNIKWLGARRGPAPSMIPQGPEDGGTIELGHNMYRGMRVPVWMKEVDRARHMYIIGKSGTGKSQLIARLAVQDIRAGHGVAVVDPHGDLTEQIVGNIPKERIDDVIYFNPSDVERPMGLNMLEAKDESQKDFMVQEMIAIFYKLFPPEMIGPMFEHYMRNVMLTLMSDPKDPGTIAEIPRMFSDEAYQKQWIARVKDPVVRSFWENEMAKTSDFHKSEMLGYLISKVGRFVENEMMRNIIGQTRSSFDFRDVMDNKRILLVNLSKGKTGEVNANLLGLIIVSKLQMAALSRADIPEEKRHDFFLYIDEFQNFITDSIATILSEARKYRLNLIIAHQYVGQLVKDNKTEIRDAVFGNVGTSLVARIGPEDVEMFEKLYAPEFGGYDLINSDSFTWYVKMIVDNAQQKAFTLNFDPYSKGDRKLSEAIKELSRLKYGRDRSRVESEIMERTQLGAEKRGPQPPALGELPF
jgi:hypothetical protein